MLFSRARGKLGVDILKFQVWCFIDFWPLFVCRWSYRWHFCMFVQGQHIDNFVIWHCFQFDLWPLICRLDKEVTVDTYACLPNTNTLTLLLLSFDTFCNLTLLWPFNRRSDGEVTVDTYACLPNTKTLTLFVIWPFLTFDPLSVGQTKRSPWTLLHLPPRLTHWPFHFCHLTLFVIWPFCDLWPLNCRSDEEVTADTYVCLPNTNTLTVTFVIWHIL